MTTPAPATTGRSSRVLTVVGVALVVVVVLQRWLSGVAAAGRLGSASVSALLVDLAVWVPLGLAIAVGLRYWKDEAGLGFRRLGVRFAVLDVFWGLAIACLCRAVGGFLSLGFFGTTGFGGSATLDGGPSVASAIVLIGGTCIVTPVIEELFFRGLFLRWLLARSREAGEGRLGIAASVVVVAIAFGLEHVLVAQTTVSVGLEEFLTTFLLGLFLGAVAVVTQRLGAAIIAHVLFNAIAVLLTWPA